VGWSVLLDGIVGAAIGAVLSIIIALVVVKRTNAAQNNQSMEDRDEYRRQAAHERQWDAYRRLLTAATVIEQEATDRAHRRQKNGEWVREGRAGFTAAVREYIAVTGSGDPLVEWNDGFWATTVNLYDQVFDTGDGVTLEQRQSAREQLMAETEAGPARVKPVEPAELSSEPPPSARTSLLSRLGITSRRRAT
jgi:hypothetical protein